MNNARRKESSKKLENIRCDINVGRRCGSTLSLTQTVRYVILVEVFDLNFIIKFKFFRK